MDTKYSPKQFEDKIKTLWEQEKVYLTEKPSFAKASEGKGKMYCLSMFPYPSGAGLHVGHVRIYTGTDVLARYFKMKGYDVLHPMGWDAFGLPAENAAIKAKKNPMDIVPGNIVTFKRQMQSLGFSYDWSREFATTDPAYYRWTQWLFIQFYKMGLLYKKDTPINWCPSCKTGLSEEEVLPNGTHERCGTAITKKDLPQWIFRITTYADRLLKDLDGLDWPEGILTMQRNWIGRSEGINFKHKVKDLGIEFEVYDSVPQTFMAQTYVVIAPEHPLVEKLVKGTRYEKPVMEFVERIKRKKLNKNFDIEKEKEGIFTGRYSENYMNTGRDLPIWVASFALVDYGTGIVGSSAHDLRDFEFAKKYGLPLHPVMFPPDKKEAEKVKKLEYCYHHAPEGILDEPIEFKGMRWDESRQPIINYIVKKDFGRITVNYHLRDWIFSRQRYWGEPIPMVHCEDCAKKGISWWDTKEGISFEKQYHNISKLDQNTRENMVGWFPIFEQNLPLELPYVKSYEPTGTGESPLSRIKEFAETTCPHCGKSAKRETDTMPNWAGSCWYFIAFSFWDKEKANSKFEIRNSKLIENFKLKIKNSSWMPVDWYLGGAEHAVLHLLYARFWVKALQDLGLLDFSEPFLKLRNVGMVLAEDHRKMSKSYGNVINPDDVVAEFGADTLRIYEMFMAPFNLEISWSTAALQGAYRFLNRIWQIYHNSEKINGREDDNKVRALLVSLKRTIKKVGEDIGQTKYNTAIAAMMEFLNDWEKGNTGLPYQEAKKFLQILSPFAPFLAEKLWREVYKETASVCISSWPEVREIDLKSAQMSIPVQVNGKVRSVLTVSGNISVQDIEKKAISDGKVQRHLGGEGYKVIYVPGKILNLVTGK